MRARTIGSTADTAASGKSVVGYVIGCKGDGTPGKCVAFQKSLNYLQDLDGNYAGTTKLRSGIMGTLGMEKCFAFPMALVNAEDRCLGEGAAATSVAPILGGVRRPYAFR